MSMCEWALKYGEKGFGVIPIPAGHKGPILEGWPELATSDADQIRAWWADDSNLNIGIVTGAKSHGIFVIDCDVDDKKGEDGREVLSRWESENGSLPETWTDISGRGGMHLYFHSDREIPNDNRTAHESIEIRGHGMNVVVPPSLHANGSRYQWEIGLSPWEIPIAEADDLVLKFCISQAPKEEKKEKFKLPVVIETGQRNYMLHRAACSMQSTGFPDEVIEAAILELNRVACREPAPEEKVRNIVKYALKYEKGGTMQRWQERAKAQEMEILEMLRYQARLKDWTQ